MSILSNDRSILLCSLCYYLWLRSIDMVAFLKLLIHDAYQELIYSRFSALIVGSKGTPIHKGAFRVSESTRWHLAYLLTRMNEHATADNPLWKVNLDMYRLLYW